MVVNLIIINKDYIEFKKYKDYQNNIYYHNFNYLIIKYNG